tara:strand:+ start:1408 stop:1851 length:444 start_codon:yes stop_codon:yes gene_type:complete
MYSHKQQYPIENIPEKIRLSDGSVRTDSSTFTADEIADAGYVSVSNPPSITEKQLLKWTGTEWSIVDNTANATLEKWKEIRTERNRRISEADARVMRYHAFARVSKEQIDEIDVLDTYIQELRDITTQSDPFNINWPTDITDKGATE